MTHDIRTIRRGPFSFFVCPCGLEQAVNRSMPWCAGCSVEYDVRLDRVVLRPERKTERLAWAKAVVASGGTAFRSDAG